MDNVFRSISILLIITLGIVLLQYTFSDNKPSDNISYSQFYELAQDKKVKKVDINTEDRLLTGEYIEPSEGGNELFKTYFRDETEPSPEKILLDNQIDFDISKPYNEGWGYYFEQSLPYLMLFTLLFIILITIRQLSSGNSQAFTFGKSRHRMLEEQKIKITFDDVEGVNEAKQELAEVVDFLKSPEKYQSLGARIPKGVLLIGEPGGGKTLLGRAVAGEAKVPFYYISGSDFVEMFVGVGASRVRDLFEQAKKTSPCIVFMDEIDAVGRQRGAGVGGGHDEREQTLNQLLVEMDGFEATENVIVIAATNRPDVLDPALLRPGRFDRRVHVDKPDVAGRHAILKIHSKGKPLSSDVDMQVLSRRTPGFSGADLENLLNEAALQAARSNSETIEMNHCEEAIDRVLMGPQRNKIITEQERESTAYHEAGHALVAHHLPDADAVRKITILPRGRTMGVTSLIPEDDRNSMSSEELLAMICVMMGGKAAESIIFSQQTTGASNDIERATKIARNMVCQYGMNDVLGPVNYSNDQSSIFLGRDIQESRHFSETYASKIDDEVRKIIDSEYLRAIQLIEDHRDQLEALVLGLLEKETLDPTDIEEIMGPKKKNEEYRPIASSLNGHTHPKVAESNPEA